jgi:hypothetical protein
MKTALLSASLLAALPFPTCRPRPPAEVAAEVKGGCVYLWWTASPEADRYRVLRLAVRGSAWNDLAATRELRLLDCTAGAPESRYVVRTESASGAVADSAEVIVRRRTDPLLWPLSPLRLVP